jgi:hypothetical protein
MVDNPSLYQGIEQKINDFIRVAGEGKHRPALLFYLNTRSDGK